MHSSKSNESHNQRYLAELLILKLCEELNAKYQTIEDCFEAIYQSLNNGQGPICRVCGCREFDRQYGDRVGKCKNCGSQTHFTANTIYEDCRNPRPYLAAFYMLGKGVIFNASQLARATRIATSTASVIYKKIQFVLTTHIKEDENAAEVNSSWFLEVMNKRSTRTPAQHHPTAEQAAIEDELNASKAHTNTQGSATAAARPPRVLTAGEQIIWDLLGPDGESFDTLLTKGNIGTGTLSHLLLIMELDGLIARNDGDWYSRVQLHYPPQSNASANANRNAQTKHTAKTANPSPAPNSTYNFRAAFPTNDVVEEIISTIIRIKDNFHGIARKYLQPYLAIYWCIDNRIKWSFETLLNACGNHGALSETEIRKYVTPLMVKIKVAA